MEKNVIEAKESLDVLCTSKALPDNHVPELRSDLENLSTEAGSLAQRLLRCLALDLQIDSEQFLNDHSGMLQGNDNNGSCLRLLHYPPAPNELMENEQNLGQNRQKITRCGKHTDYGGLTLLFQVRVPLDHNKIQIMKPEAIFLCMHISCVQGSIYHLQIKKI